MAVASPVQAEPSGRLPARGGRSSYDFNGQCFRPQRGERLLQWLWREMDWSDRLRFPGATFSRSPVPEGGMPPDDARPSDPPVRGSSGPVPDTWRERSTTLLVDTLSRIDVDLAAHRLRPIGRLARSMFRRSLGRAGAALSALCTRSNASLSVCGFRENRSSSRPHPSRR